MPAAASPRGPSAEREQLIMARGGLPQHRLQLHASPPKPVYRAPSRHLSTFSGQRTPRCEQRLPTHSGRAATLRPSITWRLRAPMKSVKSPPQPQTPSTGSVVWSRIPAKSDAHGHAPALRGTVPATEERDAPARHHPAACHRRLHLGLARRIRDPETQVDDDGDGFAAANDCNDNDKTVNPDATEAWYDDDQDCAGDDDYDADQDGWVPLEHAGLATTDVPGTGTLPAGDCDDTVPEVNPAQADTWRDGIDTDCGGEDDYDVDGDGYVRDEDAGLETAYVDGSGALPANDCDDDDDTVNPAASDTWRDGIDSDCGGEDDYDVDGDTYVRDEDVGLPTVYVGGSGSLAGGDCDDDDPAVNPAASEIWYDDIDNDCDEATNDNDADADGYLAESRGGDDCDDTRADVSPVSVEVLSDDIDHDCDGDSRTFGLDTIAAATDQLNSLAWSSPHDGVWSANSSTVYLSMASDRVDVTRPSASGGSTTVEYYDSAIAFGWDLTDLPAGPIDAEGSLQLVDWQRNAGADPVFTLTDGHDFIATDDARTVA